MAGALDFLKYVYGIFGFTYQLRNSHNSKIEFGYVCVLFSPFLFLWTISGRNDLEWGNCEGVQNL